VRGEGVLLGLFARRVVIADTTRMNMHSVIVGSNLAEGVGRRIP
jgi:hypothetical protein